MAPATGRGDRYGAEAPWPLRTVVAMIRGVSRVGTTTIGLAAAVALAVVACANHLRRATTLYDNGRYIEAAEVFEHTEYLVETAPPKDRAEYATYRGLTLLGLGDLRNAERWLAYAYQVEEASPGSLRPEVRSALDAGWESLGDRLRSGPPPPMSPPTALAASQPPPALPPPAPDPAASGGGE